MLLSVGEIQIPIAIDRAVHLLGEASIPTMIFALGYKLSEVHLNQVGRSFLFGSMRVLVGVMAGVFVAWLFNIQGVVAQVVILQSAMPPAEKYNQDSKTVASIIFAGTIISIFTTPLILAYLIE